MSTAKADLERVVLDMHNGCVDELGNLTPEHRLDDEIVNSVHECICDDSTFIVDVASWLYDQLESLGWSPPGKVR